MVAIKKKATTDQNPPPRATFTSLPPELITRIASLGDLPTALSLARVCRNFTELSSSRIWRDVNFLVPPRYRTYLTEWEEDAYCLAVCEKARKIAARLSSTTLGKIREATLLPRAGATHIMMDLLGGTAPSLKALAIEGRMRDRHDEAWRPHDFDMLDLRLLDKRISFPALTSLRLGSYAVRFAGMIPLILELAPSLTSFDLTIEQFLSRSSHTFPPFSRTKLHAARLWCSWCELESDIEDAARVIPVIEYSPHLEQLLIKYDSVEPANLVLEILGKHELLKDLYWLEDTLSSSLAGPQEDSRGRFANLRRLFLHRSDWTEVLDGLSGSFPSLETVHFQPALPLDNDTYEFDLEDVDLPNLVAPDPSIFAEPAEVQTMPHGFAKWLKASPNLRVINILRSIIDQGDIHIFSRLDDVEASGEMSGHVRSIRHGDREILHARILLNCTWNSDVTVIDGVVVPDRLLGRLWYSQREKDILEEAFPGQPTATWVNFTEFEGLTVPLGIIQRMKEVEGVKGPWEGRGIEVGEKAWQVLLDWKADVDAEAA